MMKHIIHHSLENRKTFLLISQIPHDMMITVHMVFALRCTGRMNMIIAQKPAEWR